MHVESGPQQAQYIQYPYLVRYIHGMTLDPASRWALIIRYIYTGTFNLYPVTPGSVHSMVYTGVYVVGWSEVMWNKKSRTKLDKIIVSAAPLPIHCTVLIPSPAEGR